jgi:hypothetical protein
MTRSDHRTSNTHYLRTYRPRVRITTRPPRPATLAEIDACIVNMYRDGGGQPLNRASGKEGRARLAEQGLYASAAAIMARARSHHSDKLRTVGQRGPGRAGKQP